VTRRPPPRPPVLDDVQLRDITDDVVEAQELPTEAEPSSAPDSWCPHGFPPTVPCAACLAADPDDLIQDDDDVKEEQPATALSKGNLSSVPLGRQMAAEALKGRFIHADGVGWLRWDGRRWATCSDKRVMQVAATWAEKFIIKLIRSGAPDEAVKTALRYREVGNVTNLVKGAMTAQGTDSILVDVADLDRDPDLLNVGNGTLHLPTGTLRPHNPDDLITKLTKVDFVPDASHPDVAAALDALDPEIRDYARRSFGAAATGYMGSDDRMEVHSGGGENGKTTVVGSVFHALGEYATIVPDELVLASTGHQHPTLLMTLRGARLALLEELPDGHTFNVARVKKTVGTPTITGRLIGHDFVTFKTSHTMVVTTNYLPLVTETDHGTWRRLVRIPYPYQYGKDRPKDPGLRERVLHGKAQQQAVLAWIAAGARDWYTAGRTLGDLPTTLVEAVREWRGSTDLLFLFAEECLNFGHTGDVYERTEDLRQAFNAWLKPPSRPWTQRTFSERIANHPAFTEAGAEVGKHPKTRQSVVWHVALKPTVAASWAG
jgi:putative DNA primase/helicase